VYPIEVQELYFFDIIDMITPMLQLVHYQRQKTLAFQDALSRYAEAKVKTATDTYALLSKALTNIKQMELNV
jgi:hypothetical protein